MSTQYAMQPLDAHRANVGSLQALSDLIDQWCDAPGNMPPFISLLGKTQAIIDDTVADAAAKRRRLRRAGYSPPKGDTRHLSPLTVPERIDGTLVSLIG